jgi:cytoskeleton protein RodZ
MTMTQDWEDRQQDDESAATPSSSKGPGAQMQAAREAMGLSIEQLADQLKLSPRQITALEAQDFASLPPPAVVRGFIRAYAKAVKLDAAPLMEAVPMDTPQVETAATTRSVRPAAMPGARFPSNGKKRGNGPMLALGAVVVLGVAGAAAWQAGLLNGPQAPAAVETPVLPTVQEPAQTIQPNVPLISVPPTPGQIEASASAPAAMPELAANPAATTPAGQAPVAAPAAAPTAAPTPAPTAAPTAAPVAAPAPGANTLVVTVKSESWVEVRPVGGAKAYAARLAKAGETITVEVSGPTQLIVGNPEGVSATLRGSAVSLPPLPGKTVSRVTLK